VVDRLIKLSGDDLGFFGLLGLINLIEIEDMRGGAELILLATFDKGTHGGASGDWVRAFGRCRIRAGR